MPSDLTATIPYLATSCIMLVYVVVSSRHRKKKQAARELEMSGNA